MLPRAEAEGAQNPQLNRFNQLRNQILSEDPAPRQPADPYRTAPREPPPLGTSGEPPVRAPSLRESLLKKPLSSIIRK